MEFCFIHRQLLNESYCVPGTGLLVEMAALNETHSCLLGAHSHTRVKTDELQCKRYGRQRSYQKEQLLT